MRPVLHLLLLLISTLACFAQSTSLQPGDQVEVRPLTPAHPFSSLLTLKLTVSSEGRLEHPDLGINCDVLGLEPSDAKSILHAELPRPDGEDRPQLSVLATRKGKLLVNQNAVIIRGHVRNPGFIEYKPGMTLAQVVTAAGGATAFGATTRIRVIRNGKVCQYDLRNPKHVQLAVTKNDIIEIPQKRRLDR